MVIFVTTAAVAIIAAASYPLQAQCWPSKGEYSTQYTAYQVRCLSPFKVSPREVHHPPKVVRIQYTWHLPPKVVAKTT
jgi:hypothetical protein